MNRRTFIKTIAAASTAPLALLKAKPAARFIELEAGEVHKSKVFECYGRSPMLGDKKYDDQGRVWRYCKFEPNNEQHRIISETFGARPGKRWMQVYGPRQVKVI